ncbi:hypothetical protein SISNIDRAFT_411274 [Sistotremastrum niveocremeum HHB9708]|uniref:Pyridoxamine 5'-phosphate oxidase Alr4036 family FMN-binding domain-containing protein n=2 Tax=Sistotremastraceae TaxID=3402574 RepID=A0A164UTL9_9AGAM|nr:hypothetical protein SISNIDRAFT_411274 [Sistotremastrum niveocremeum HHB9708]KZT42696.1 hypothetical protein SISSUDRAFT_979716 [Sistotremastrum suecicum HHB10207 ss-3]
MSAPRWKKALERALDANKKSVVYSFATVDLSVQPPQPRTRTVVHRGFVEPKGASHPLLLTTTDIRAAKVHELNGDANAELAWWIEGTQEQWRLASRAYIVPHPEHAEQVKIPQALFDIADGHFWEKERERIFNSLSGHMRASWARPAPGSPIPSYDEGKKWPEKLGGLGEGKNEEEEQVIRKAFENFALVVLQPFAVDYVELGVVPNQRTKFTQAGETWKEVIVVP